MKTDAQIQADVMQELKWDPSITHEHVGVAVVLDVPPRHDEGRSGVELRLPRERPVAVVQVEFVSSAEVCDRETRRFNEEAAKLGDDIVIYTISTDFPMAQKRWCGAAGIDKVKVVSDVLEADFGIKYGLLIKERRYLRRAVFIVGRDGKLTYVKYMPVLGQEPDYDEVINQAKSALK